MTGFGACGLEVPVIETQRLRLRGHRPEDFADCAAMWGDPVVTRYIGGKPLSEEEAWGRTLRGVGHWAWLGFGYWVVEEKATGSFAGHGKGYATEAVRAALAWGDENIKRADSALGRTVCIIHPEHTRSIRVAEKCGFKELLRTTCKGEPTILFGQ